MTFTFVPFCLLLSSICWVSSLVIIKMIEEELNVTFFFGLSPPFWDITIGRIGLSFSSPGVSFAVLWNLIKRKHRSCKRHCRNCKRKKTEWNYNLLSVHYLVWSSEDSNTVITQNNLFLVLSWFQCHNKQTGFLVGTFSHTHSKGFNRITWPVEGTEMQSNILPSASSAVNKEQE